MATAPPCHRRRHAIIPWVRGALVNDLLMFSRDILINGRAGPRATFRHEGNRVCVHAGSEWPSLSKTDAGSPSQRNSAAAGQLEQRNPGVPPTPPFGSTDLAILDLVHRKSAT